MALPIFFFNHTLFPTYEELIATGTHSHDIVLDMKSYPKKIDSLQIWAILRRFACFRRLVYLYDPLNVFFLTFRSIRPGVFRFFAIAFLISENELSKVGDIARFSAHLPQADPKYLQGAKRAPPVFPGKK